jgi:hypothetical protein
MRRLLPLFPLLLIPQAAFAQVEAIGRVVGLFNVFVGLMLTAALLIYGVGFSMWWIRLGSWPSYRTDAIRALEWAVATLFTLVVLLGIVQFFQQHREAAMYVVSVIVLVLVIWAIVYMVRQSSGGEEKEKH